LEGIRPEAEIVNVSVESLVVRVILDPPTKVNVSLLVSVVIVFCPDTAMFLNIPWLEPRSVLVIVALPVPVILIPVPFVRNVVIRDWDTNPLASVFRIA
jgi:hypothetical protein